MTSSISSMQGYALDLKLEIEDAIQFIEEVTSEYEIPDSDNSDAIKTAFSQQAAFILKDIECLNLRKEMSGLEVSDCFERLKSAFQSFLDTGKTIVGKDEILKHQIALLDIEKPFKSVSLVEQIDPLYRSTQNQIEEWTERLDEALANAQNSDWDEERQQFLIEARRDFSMFMKGSYPSIKGSLRSQACKAAFTQLEESFDRLTEYQRTLSGKKTSGRFRERFLDFFTHTNPFHSASSLSSPSPSISPLIQLVAVADQTLPLPVETTPSRSSSSSSSTQVSETQQPTRSSGRKRTVSSRLAGFSAEEEQSPSPVVKKARVVESVKRMPFLTSESFGEPESLDTMINSLKPEGKRTNKIYISSNKYDLFYEQFWGGKNGWAEYYRNTKLNTSENKKLKDKYEAFKKQTLKERSELFRIRQSEEHKIFGSMLFTTKTIGAGEIVGEYVGNLVPKTLQTGGNKYVFEFSSEDPKIEKYVIDGEGLCNEMAFLVHNSEENSTTKIVEYYDEEGPHILIIAKKEIPAGHAPSFNYSDGYWEAIGIKPLCLPH